ncbi:SCO2400 family protein [Streptomyces chengbuensis]|uniref:SCO2400 family protein n=1 Tax=Streptomyces chengbuensis TaxID=3053466 RepID=UPI003F4D1E74
MDYCSSCRRDLNGALVCPGCGAYAPDIAPPSQRHHGGGASTVTARLATGGQGVSDRGSYPEAAAYFDAAANGTRPVDGPAGHATDAVTTSTTEASGSDSSGGIPSRHTGTAEGEAAADAGISGGSATGQGRAARRRQLARWKKHRRRAAAATAVALVGGGLTIAALPTGKPSTGHAHASAPPEPTSGATPSGSVSPDGPSAEAPDTATAQRPGTGRPAATSGHQGGAEATTPRADTERSTRSRTAGQPETAPDESSAQRSSVDRHTAPPAAPRTPEQPPGGDAPATPAPGTTAPPPAAETPGPATPPASLLPTTPGGSPVQVCLVGLCIG